MVGQMTLIAIGSNQACAWGHARATVTEAIRRVSMLAAGPVRVSALYATPAFPAGAGPDFVNAALAFGSLQAPRDILTALHLIEAAAGRHRQLRWGQRTLDLDLIGMGDHVLPDVDTQTHWRALAADAQTTVAPDQLILPHPRVQDRSFVLVPLADVAPDWRHPLLDMTVTQMLDQLSAQDRASVVPLADPRFGT
jgi:2-amino-4-hydroxy-6-hydroxymethyldihydropteridine diphosphokinase